MSQLETLRVLAVEGEPRTLVVQPVFSDVASAWLLPVPEGATVRACGWNTFGAVEWATAPPVSWGHQGYGVVILVWVAVVTLSLVWFVKPKWPRLALALLLLALGVGVCSAPSFIEVRDAAGPAPVEVTLLEARRLRGSEPVVLDVASLGSWLAGRTLPAGVTVPAQGKVVAVALEVDPDEPSRTRAVAPPVRIDFAKGEVPLPAVPIERTTLTSGPGFPVTLELLQRRSSLEGVAWPSPCRARGRSHRPRYHESLFLPTAGAVAFALVTLVVTLARRVPEQRGHIRNAIILLIVAWPVTHPGEVGALLRGRLGEPTVPHSAFYGRSPLRAMVTAQALFREMDKEGDGVLDYGTLAELGKAGLVDSVTATGKHGGYAYRCEPDRKEPEFLWSATATSRAPGGVAYFVDQSGVIRSGIVLEVDGRADADDFVPK